jgi:flagella basal body P-ring formation protein FlgA
VNATRGLARSPYPLLRAALAALLALALGSLPGSALRAAGVVHVPAEVSVDGPVIALGEIAVFDGLSQPAQARLAARALGPAGAPASQQTLIGARVRQAIQSIDSGIQVDVPDRITVHRSGEKLVRAVIQQRVERAIRHLMVWPSDAVQFQQWALPDSMAAPAGFTRLLVGFRPSENFRARVPIQLELVDPQHPEQPGIVRSASVEVEVRVPVGVAARNLNRGETLDRDALRFETRELRRLPDEVVMNLDQALGQQLVVAVREGAPLLFGYFAAADLVRRGDVLAVDASHGGLEVRMEARALEPGKLGQLIHAQNPASRREFQVEVTGPRTARLALPQVGDEP